MQSVMNDTFNKIIHYVFRFMVIHKIKISYELGRSFWKNFFRYFMNESECGKFEMT